MAKDKKQKNNTKTDSKAKVSLTDLKCCMAQTDLPRSQKCCELEHQYRAASLFATTF